jgi:hypothetical protein
MPKSTTRPTSAAKKAPRARSAYAIFASEYRGTLTDPPASFGELSRQCAAAWKTVEDKAPYEARAAEDRARVAAAAAAAPAATETASAATVPTTKKARKPSAFLRFSSVERRRIKEADPDVSFGDLARRCSVAWRALTAEERAAYEAEAVSA